MSDDTIFALSSGRLPAEIAVVRISGANARVGLETFGVKLPEPRLAARAKLIDPDSRETVDDALALWFQGPKSETGEDMVELHLHGGRACPEVLPDRRQCRQIHVDGEGSDGRKQAKNERVAEKTGGHDVTFGLFRSVCTRQWRRLHSG